MGLKSDGARRARRTRPDGDGWRRASVKAHSDSRHPEPGHRYTVSGTPARAAAGNQHACHRHRSGRGGHAGHSPEEFGATAAPLPPAWTALGALPPAWTALGAYFLALNVWVFSARFWSSALPQA